MRDRMICIFDVIVQVLRSCTKDTLLCCNNSIWWLWVKSIYLNAVRCPYVCNARRSRCPRPGLSCEWRHNENNWLSRCRYRPKIWRLATGTGCERRRREPPG